MKDTELRKHILDELDFDPSLDAANIGVAVENGIVSLSGHVSSYAEKFDAERAVQRVKGVRGIAEAIEVRFPSAKKTADDQIAKRALDIMEWDSTVPKDAVQVKVHKGWITLSGKVDWHFQRSACEGAVRRLSGVAGVVNLMEVQPRVQAENVKNSIGLALQRSAEVEAKGIQIDVQDGKVTLTGDVHSWRERDAVQQAAWSVPGVTTVTNHLAVG